MPKRLFLAEKPSVGKLLADALGGGQRCPTHYETSGGVVTWAIGHVLELIPPGDYKPEWKARGFAGLPIIPETFRWEPSPDTRSQLQAIGRLLRDLGRDGEVVISTDAGPEGELIAREILDHFDFRGRVSRLWAGATDPVSLGKALANLRTGESTAALYEAARARSCSDWLIGMNLSRALTAACLPPNAKLRYAVGRVMSPTLALVVRRDRAIRDFQPRDYYEVVADVRTVEGSHQVALRYGPPEEEKRLWERAHAEALAREARGTNGTLRVEQTTVKNTPPSPLALGDLQKVANRRFKWPAKKTLQLAQSLYEKHKAVTYPRSDCSFLPEEQWPDVPGILQHLQRPGILPTWPAAGWEPLRRRSVWNTAKVGEHHAIIPTGQPAPWEAMDADERECYRIVVQHYVGCLLPDAEALQTVISLPAAGVLFETRGSVPKVVGWRVVFPPQAKAAEVELPPVRDGMAATVADAKVEGKKTKPPAAYTEATLLADMENVAKFVADPRLQKVLRTEEVAGSDAKRARGIGTVATRADTIEKLKRTLCMEATGGKLASTDHGQRLVAELERRLPEFADPGLTAVWELDQEEIVAGKQTFGGFVGKVGTTCTEAVEKLRSEAPPEAQSVSRPLEDGTLCPKSHQPVLDVGDHFAFPGYPGVRCWKEVSGRPMTVADFLAVFAAAPEAGPTLEGFTSKASGKGFRAALCFAPDPKTKRSFSFVFPESAADGSGAGAAGGYYTLDEAPGVRCWHILAKRPMTEEDYRGIVLAGKEGVRLEGFKSKSDKAFGAVVVFNKRAKPHPKFEFQFNDDAGKGGKNGAKPPAAKPSRSSSGW